MHVTIAAERGTYLLVACENRFTVLERRNGRLYNCHDEKREGIPLERFSSISEIVDDGDWVDEPNAQAAFDEAAAQVDEISRNTCADPAVRGRANKASLRRNGALRIEHSDGYEMEGREAVRHLCDDWLAANALYGRPGPNASQSVSVVLSMAPVQIPTACRMQPGHELARTSETMNGSWFATTIRSTRTCM